MDTHNVQQTESRARLASAGNLTGRRVFVVEDEAMVSMLIEDTLTELGCEVVDTSSRYDDALAKAKSLSFDVAVLDVNLDGQRTYQIAAALNERGLPFVFATGYSATSLPQAFHGTPTLQKPFRQREMERALGAALGLH